MRNFLITTSCAHTIALMMAMGAVEQTAAAPAPNAAPPAPPVSAAPPVAAAPPVPATAPAPPVAPATAPPAAPAATSGATEAQLQEAINAYARTHGVTGVKAKFAELSITKIGDIPAEHYASYIPHFAV